MNAYCNPLRGILYLGDNMSKKKKRQANVTLNPEDRLVTKFDATGIDKFPVKENANYAPIVVDNCAEEHIM